jgi:hypothetical protein
MLPLKVAANLSKPLNCSQWQTELIFHLSAMLATGGKQSGNRKYWEPVTVRKTRDFTLAVLVSFGISDIYIGFTCKVNKITG